MVMGLGAHKVFDDLLGGSAGKGTWSAHVHGVKVSPRSAHVEQCKLEWRGLLLVLESMSMVFSHKVSMQTWPIGLHSGAERSGGEWGEFE